MGWSREARLSALRSFPCAGVHQAENNSYRVVACTIARVVKRSLVLVAAAAVVAAVAAVVFAALYFAREPATRTVIEKPCGDRIFGHIILLTLRGDHFEMRFDPAWFTSGATANTAAAEDGVVEPGQPVPNDNYVIEEGHRSLTYIVPPGTHVTVLTRKGDPANFGATPIAVAQLAQIVGGGKQIELYEPLDSGVWIRVHVDTACSIDQQYHP